MKKVEFNIPIYDIDVVLAQVEDHNDKDEVEELIKDYNMNPDDKSTLLKVIECDNEVGAVTLHEENVWTITTIFYKMKDEDTKWSSYGHEKRHLEDEVLSRMGINDREAAAYLSGWLTLQFKKLADMYIISKTESY